MSGPNPTSEVGLDFPPTSGTSSRNMQENIPLPSNSLEAFLSKLTDALPPRPDAPPNPFTVLVPFDPDDPNSDIEGWCRLSDTIISSKNLKGVDLIMTLTHCLRGRAATLLTKIPPSQYQWENIQETLKAQFSRPMLIQDHFDSILKFQINTNETPVQACLRLWQLIENIPEARLSEKVVTGFAISVLSQCDVQIRRELNSTIVNDKSQLFRVLRGISLKRKSDLSESNDFDVKRPRTTFSFRGSCNICGRNGHRGADCRDRNKPQSHSIIADKRVNQKPHPTCYVCGEPGHVVPTCPRRADNTKKGQVATGSKEVNVCSKIARGVMDCSGMKFSFIFDSGSECSLIKKSFSHLVIGQRLHDLINMTGIGKSIISSTEQIVCDIHIQSVKISVTLHIVPDDCLRDAILLGRDILERDILVEISETGLIVKRCRESNVCTKIEPIFDIESINTDLTGSDRVKLFDILTQYADNFIDNFPTTRIKTGQLKIDLIDPHKVVHRRPYRLSPQESKVVDEKIEKLLAANIIRESSSPFASPIILVDKKNGGTRMCVDYRELNSNTQPIHYPLPLISEQIDKLNGAHYFCSIDMASGFHQLPVHENSVEKTAFVTPKGQFEYLAMPFGLRNAPSIFQKAINTALKPMNDEKILVFMDDVLSISKDIDEGLNRLDKLLKTLSNAGFSFNLKKCSFLKVQTEYLGYIVSAGEIRPNPKKIQALVDVPAPKTVTQVRQLIGLATYFRQFIPNFSQIIRPLYPLTKGKGNVKWTPEHDQIHKKIIHILTSEPVLKVFDPALPIELHTDASSEGYGAILIQKHNDTPHVVAYYSRKTIDAETRYHSYELETLAVVKAIEHFRHYLHGQKFTVFTDCNSLKASHSKRDLTPRVHRWWAILQAYDFDIVYKEGRKMAHADFLSRNLSNTNYSEPRKVNFLELDKNWLIVEQERDPELSEIISKIRNNQLPEEILHTYDLRQGILYRKIERRGVSSWLPIVPRSLVWSLISHVHNEIKHLGFDKTLDKLYEFYWFPDMAKFVKKFINCCVVCKTSKGPSGAQQMQLHSIPKHPVPWHTVHLDLTGKLSGKSDRKEYCSVLIDAFTKFVLLEYTPALNSSYAVRAIKNAVNLFGAPKRIIADRGRCYDCNEFKNFCNDNKIELHLIATGSSRANGQVERVMQTLKNIFTVVECNTNNSWRDELGEIQLALNSTRSRTTGYTPIELMFGIQGSSLNLAKIAPSSSKPPVINVETARSSASENIQKVANADTIRFNKGKARIKPFAVGQFVFVKCEERCQTKLDSKFKGPYKIITVLDNDRYELRHINGSNRIYKIAHENLREVPKGQEGYLQIYENCNDENDDDERTVTVDEYSIPIVPVNNSNVTSDSEETLTVSSRTLSANDSEETLSVSSRTLSVDNSEAVIESLE